MDLSKLPRMSESPPPPAPAPDTTPEGQQPPHAPGSRPAPMDYAPVPGDSSGAEAWMSIAIGVILLLLSPRPIQYLLSPASFAEKWTFTDPQGNPLPYTQTVFFWGDIALTAFALVLILEGLVLAFAARRFGFVAAAFAFTVLVAALNLVYVAAMMQKGYGLQLMSALAVAFGGYIAMFQWRLLQNLRYRRHA